MDAQISRPGDRPAGFDRDVMSHYSSLRAFAISLSGNADRANDLTQETIARALKHHEMFQPGTNLPAWLFTILRNLFRSEHRKFKRNVEWDPKYENSLHFSSLFDEAETATDFKQFLRLLACIPVVHADAIVAVGYLGMTYEAAAEALRCEVGTVKSRVNRAREMLTDLMRNPSSVERIDIEWLKHAANNSSRDDPYHVIACAYQELYSDFSDDEGEVKSSSENNGEKPADNLEEAWQKLVASGALQEDDSETLNLSDLDSENL